MGLELLLCIRRGCAPEHQGPREVTEDGPCLDRDQQYAFLSLEQQERVLHPGRCKGHQAGEKGARGMAGDIQGTFIVKQTLMTSVLIYLFCSVVSDSL